ncbi:MAG: 1,4-alpha-glucan branching protein domain-containing protein [Acidobacteriota bacterium]
MPPEGYLSIVLHAHLPFVRHPELPHFLEESWLFEAVAESYIPLILLLRRLELEGTPCRLTLSISPTLAEMLADPLLQERCAHYLQQRVELSEKEIERHRPHPRLRELAKRYLSFYSQGLRFYEDTCGRDLIRAFHKLREAGLLDLMTSSATHAFLPFVSNAECQRAQLVLAQQTHARHFGRASAGLWLPECGYQPELDELVHEAQFRHFLLDAHAVLLGNPHPRFGNFAPVQTPGGVVAFARDTATSQQVWSSRGGYPGDFDYREFYRDVGFDADYDYVKPYLQSDGSRHNLGIKYHRITGEGDLGQRELYDWEQAEAKARMHADHFVGSRLNQVKELAEPGFAPLIVAPYDAELFGHWWFEGPVFLESVIRLMARESRLHLVTLEDFLKVQPKLERQQPTGSSWGTDGYNLVWLNTRNQWLYRHQHWAEHEMVGLANQNPEATGSRKRMLNQAARELLLAQSSDWAFLISQNTAAPYAVQRFRTHLERFRTLREQLLNSRSAPPWLEQVEAQDSIFPELDYRLFRSDCSADVSLVSSNNET